jgi:hypothetical protein
MIRRFVVVLYSASVLNIPRFPDTDLFDLTMIQGLDVAASVRQRRSMGLPVPLMTVGGAVLGPSI